ncbi:MAG: hypothetical protein ACRDQ1_03790 [Sciscionella sp.]
MIVQILEYAAWVISACLAAWMLFDTVRTSMVYDEEFLTTSVEGADEMLELEAIERGDPR